MHTMPQEDASLEPGDFLQLLIHNEQIGGGSIAQLLVYLIPVPSAPGFNDGSRVFFSVTTSMLLR